MGVTHLGVRIASLSAAFILSLTSANAQTQMKSFTGSEANEYFGTSSYQIGDVNGDGFADALLGSPEFGPHNRGRIQIVSGYNGQTLHVQEGPRRGAHFGHSAAKVGDLNNDGRSEFVVGAPYISLGGVRGRAYVLNGRDYSVMHELPGTSYYGRHGWAVAGIGDYNNDGFEDIAVGDHLADTSNGNDSGRVRIYSGYDARVIADFTGEQTGAYFGRAVSAAGDVNNDGFLDIAIGAPFDRSGGWEAGKLYIYSGADNSLIRSVQGETRERLGYALAPAGKLNSDNNDDLFVGAPGYDNYRGRVFALSVHNGREIYSHEGEVTGDQFGFSLAAGNYLGSRTSKLEVATGSYNGGYASVLQWSSGLVSEIRLDGVAMDKFGHSVGNASDVNMDGNDDLYVSSPFASGPADRAGEVSIYSVNTLQAPKVSRDAAQSGYLPPEIALTTPDLRTKMTITGSGLGVGGVGVALVMAPPAPSNQLKWRINGHATGLDYRHLTFLGGRFSDNRGVVTFENIRIDLLPYAASNHSRFGYAINYVLVRVPNAPGLDWGVSETKKVEVGYTPAHP